MKDVYIFPYEDSLDRPNLVYIKGKDKSLLLDAGGGPKTYRYIKEQLDKYNLLDPDYILISHYHWDHLFGIGYFKGIKMGTSYTEQKIEELMEQKPKFVNDIISNDSQPEFCREHLILEYGETLKELRLAKLDVLVDKPVKLDLGKRELDIIPVTCPHTEGSLIVFDKESGILFIFDADYGRIDGCEFIDDDEKKKEFLKVVKQIPAKYVLKGHSDIRTYKEYLDEEDVL